MAEYSVLILQVLLLQMLLLQTLLLQTLLLQASARTLATTVLIVAATTPCSRLNLALVVAVELRLLLA